jgi:hypothetical protein
MAAVDKLLLHTTESAGWPSYPTFSPTLTFNPWKPRGSRWRQHCYINQAATTLANAGDYRTNRANVVQIEIVAYCDPAKKTSSAHIDKISSDAYHELAEFYAWLHAEWGTELFLYPKWKPYPESYGKTNGVRMSVAQFGTFKGLCGHMHAPEQSHGDPGSLKVGLIVDLAKQIAGDAEPPPPPPQPASDAVNVTPEQIAIAKAAGMNEVDLIARCCNETGARFYLTLAMLEMETTTCRNVYGGDAGGVLSKFKEPVDRSNYLAFRHEVLVADRTSNGVGPSQITSKGLLRDMEAKGLKPWDMHDNIGYGAKLIMSYYRDGRNQGKSVSEALWYAGKRYNSKDAYADEYLQVAQKWKDRVGSDDYLPPTPPTT